MPAKDRRKPPFDRAMEKIERDLATGCWIWTARTTPTGCPLLWVHEKDTEVSASRIVYEHLVGPIPTGMRLFHCCGNRKCVNPDHLEPATKFEAMTRSARSPSIQNSRKTHCPKGHPYEGDNLAWDKAGHNRLCRQCRRDRSREAMRLKYVPVAERKANTEPKPQA